MRYKKENHNSFHIDTCVRCGENVTRRNSWAVELSGREAAALVSARDVNKRPVTLKAGPRIHREPCV